MEGVPVTRIASRVLMQKEADPVLDCLKPTLIVPHYKDSARGSRKQERHGDNLKQPQSSAMVSPKALLSMVSQPLAQVLPIWSRQCRDPAAGQADTEILLQRIVDASAANVAAFDEAGDLLYASRAWRLFAEQNGFGTAKQAFGLHHLRACNEFPRREGRGLAEAIQQVLRGQHLEFHQEYVFEGATTTKWFLVRAARLDMLGGFRVLVTLEDMTRQRQAEEELRNIGGRLINAQEEERSHVARELSQRLAMLSIEIEQLRQKIPAKDKDLARHVQQVWSQTQELCSEVHRLSYQLHPYKLDHLGLSAAIKCLCEELSEHQDLRIKFQQKGFPVTLPPNITLCIFRVAQESLHNIMKHSGAHEARVLLTKTSEVLRLRVVDKGCGFDIEQAKTKKRLGLISMRERLRLVGGEIAIRSQPSKGTEIDVLVPLQGRV